MKIKIGNTELGETCKVFIIAEMSANHGGDKERAYQIIRAAKNSGANAIKLQTYTADTITFKSKMTDFRLSNDSPWGEHKYLWDLYNAAKTPYEWHYDLFALAGELGLEIFSSPFDAGAVDLLENLKVSAYKIASPEIVDIPLLKEVASTKKPVILSAGLATEEDIDFAINYLRDNGSSDIALLKCNTAYPAPLEESNLKTISDIQKKFGVIPGFSDHSIGSLAGIVAVAMGAKIIEKHITAGIEKTVDSFFSLDENSFSDYVCNIRDAELSIGRVNYEISPSAYKNLNGRRSLYCVENIKSGELITNKNIRSIRPGYGIHPKYFWEILGKKAVVDIDAGERISWDKIEK